MGTTITPPHDPSSKCVVIFLYKIGELAEKRERRRKPLLIWTNTKLQMRLRVNVRTEEIEGPKLKSKKSIMKG